LGSSFYFCYVMFVVFCCLLWRVNLQKIRLTLFCKHLLPRLHLLPLTHFCLSCSLPESRSGCYCRHSSSKLDRLSRKSQFVPMNKTIQLWRLTTWDDYNDRILKIRKILRIQHRWSVDQIRIWSILRTNRATAGMYRHSCCRSPRRRPRRSRPPL